MIISFNQLLTCFPSFTTTNNAMMPNFVWTAFYMFPVSLCDRFLSWAKGDDASWSLHVRLCCPELPPWCVVLHSPRTRPCWWAFECFCVEANLVSGSVVPGYLKFAFLFSWMKLSVSSCSHVISFFTSVKWLAKHLPLFSFLSIGFEEGFGY